MGPTLVGLAEAVQIQPDVAPFREPQLPPQRAAHQDELCIDVWAWVSERLRAGLVELPVASLLRPLVAEHGPDVEQALAAIVQQRVFVDRANDTGGVLRAQ